VEYISVKEVAEKWNISRRRVQVLCEQNRIVGQARVGSTWIIPKNSEKPIDARIKSGKYIKKDEK
jgi:hypothetical protein